MTIQLLVHRFGVAALALAFLGCGGSVSVAEGPMPEGGSFTGVWHSPQYGRMEMVQTGSNVVGAYIKDERSGRIQGTASGNLMRFQWSEEREMVAGHPITTRGRGYFLYAIGDDGDHYIRGRWGLDSDDSEGGEWNAARDRRARPNLNPDGTSGSSGGEEDDVEAFDTADGSSDSSDDSDGDDLDL